ncbi:MAG: hypothetical protein HYS25_08875 [Ignavibacteriales bacterium]|nr:hypothetical protein [Ignavibacteriales bacterium]
MRNFELARHSFGGAAKRVQSDEYRTKSDELAQRKRVQSVELKLKNRGELKGGWLF